MPSKWGRALSVRIRRDLVIELLIVASVGVAAFAGASLFDLPERWHSFSRAHEDLELDEVTAAAVALSFATIWFAWRRWREEHRALQNLQESEERFRAVVDSSPHSIYLLDTDGRIILCNMEFQRRFGLSAEQILGKTAFELQSQDVAHTYAAATQRVLDTGQITQQLVNQSYPDGSSRINLSVKFPVWGADRQPIAVGAINTDVTGLRRTEEALRESEAQLRLITDNLPVQVVYVDAERRYRFVNKICETWYGRPADSIIGKTVDEVLGKEAYAALKPNIDAVLSGQTINFDHNILYPDDRERAVRGAYVPDLDAKGRVVGYFSLIEDVTELQEIEDQLRQAQKMEAIGQLTGGVAHDFNNLLAVIVGNLEFLLERVEDPAGRRQAESALRSALRGAELTQRLLAFARKQTLHPQHTDLRESISELTDLLQRALGEAVTVTTVQSSEPVLAEVDRTQLETALLNLALNARDAMPEGGELRIETVVQELGAKDVEALEEVLPGRYAVIFVKDSGQGMAADIVDRVFVPFFTTKDVGEGSGLGLSMVHGFARQSGGHVTVASEEGRGTTVRLFFPAASAPAVHSQAKPIDATVPQGAGEIVLVVEDDPDLRDLATSMLASLGYQVLGAENAMSALESLRQNPAVDLLFTDVELPNDMTGAELAGKAREQLPDLRVLYTSGYTRHTVGQGGIQLDGEADLLIKPYRRQSLAQRIYRALHDAGHGVA